MRYISLIGLSFFLLTDSNWKTDFEEAKQIAHEKHEAILLNFSGSDWCGPCIRLKKEIFDSKVFTQYADHLVLVNADFPRLGKHKLPDAQQLKNDQLAELYNKKGIFPLTLLLTEDGKIIKQWEGLPGISPEAFTNEIKTEIDGSH